MNNRGCTIIGYRANASELAMLDSKVKASGLTRSEFLRRLVEIAEVEPVKIKAKLNSCDNTKRMKQVFNSPKS